MLLACCSKEIGVLAAGAPLAAWLLRRAGPSDGRVGEAVGEPLRSGQRSTIQSRTGTLTSIGFHIILIMAVSLR